MLDKGICVLNFDNSIIQQSKLLCRYPAKIINLAFLAQAARLYMSAATRKKISNLVPAENNYPTFIGSGDFHHISEILTSRIMQPACLIVFDFHPDWDSLPPRFGCGSWVGQALKNKNISKCLLIGVGSDDLSSPGLQTANLGALTGDRLEIYPYQHKSSRVYLRQVPPNYSLTTQKGIFSHKISWHQLASEDLKEFTSELIQRLPERRIYISIDKDCLNREAALTNWEEGFLKLSQLLAMLKLLRENLEIIGLDIVGDYSSCQGLGRMKAAISRLDHPHNFAARGYPDELILQANQESNLAILEEIFA